MGREATKTTGCFVALLLLVLAVGWSVRHWFDELEVNLTLGVYAAGYSPAEFRVTSTVYTPILSANRGAFYRADGTVVAGTESSDEESLSLNGILASKPPRNPTELGELVPAGTVFKVLFNPSLPRRRSTFESPRVIPFRNDFVRTIRVELLVSLVKTFWPPALWVFVMFLYVRHQTPRWKKQRVGLR